VLPQAAHPASGEGRRPGLLGHVLGHESERFTGLFRMRHPTLLTPRDFDLSPYFEVVKFNAIASGHFDYERIRWAEQGENGAEG
jgi:hypothetical protein